MQQVVAGTVTERRHSRQQELLKKVRSTEKSRGGFGKLKPSLSLLEACGFSGSLREVFLPQLRLGQFEPRHGTW